MQPSLLVNYCGEESVNQTRSNDRIVIAMRYSRWSRTKSKDYHEWRALLTCFASSEWSILSSNSRRTFQVASIPFPVNQCFMVAWQQATGPSNLCSALMRSCIQSSGSKLRRAPSCFHWSSICLMICIFSPLAHFIFIRWARVGFSALGGVRTTLRSCNTRYNHIYMHVYANRIAWCNLTHKIWFWKLYMALTCTGPY